MSTYLIYQLSRVLKPGEVTEFGYSSHCDRGLHPTESLERVDDRGEAPGRHLVGKFLVQTRQPFGVFGDRTDVLLEHDLLCRGGTDDLAEPSEVGWSPGGSARITDIVPQEKGFQPKLRGLQITDGIFTRPAQVSNRFILNRWDIDRGEVARAHQASQFDGIPAVGFDPIPGLFGD